MGGSIGDLPVLRAIDISPQLNRTLGVAGGGTRTETSYLVVLLLQCPRMQTVQLMHKASIRNQYDKGEAPVPQSTFRAVSTWLARGPEQYLTVLKQSLTDGISHRLMRRGNPDRLTAPQACTCRSKPQCDNSRSYCLHREGSTCLPDMPFNILHDLCRILRCQQHLNL
jgi:hypothetical protein